MAVDGGERLAGRAHLGKLVAAMGAEGTRRPQALCGLGPLLGQGTLRQFEQSRGGGRAWGHRTPGRGGQPGRMEGKCSPNRDPATAPRALGESGAHSQPNRRKWRLAWLTWTKRSAPDWEKWAQIPFVSQLPR